MPTRGILRLVNNFRTWSFAFGPLQQEYMANRRNIGSASSFLQPGRAGFFSLTMAPHCGPIGTEGAVTQWNWVPGRHFFVTYVSSVNLKRPGTKPFTTD